MKRTASMILLTASCLVLIVSLVFCFASVYEINRTLHDLASTPGSGGIDYWGIGWGAGICLLALSVLGSILSILSMKQLRHSMLRYASVIATVAFALLFAASIFLFYI